MVAVQKMVIPAVLFPCLYITLIAMTFVYQGILHDFNIPRDEQEAAEGVS